MATSAALFLFLQLARSQRSSCRVGYCLECEPSSNIDCIKCKADYKVVQNGYGNFVCRPDFFQEGCRVKNCEACKTLESEHCMSCKNGFTGTKDRTKCTSYGILILFVCISILILPPLLYFCVYCVVKCRRKKQALEKQESLEANKEKKKASLEARGAEPQGESRIRVVSFGDEEKGKGKNVLKVGKKEKNG